MMNSYIHYYQINEKICRKTSHSHRLFDGFLINLVKLYEFHILSFYFFQFNHQTVHSLIKCIAIMKLF